MIRRVRKIALALAAAVALGGCTRGGNDVFARGAEHFEFHTYDFYRKLTALHYDFDRYFLGLDERNPDHYP